MLGLLLLRNYTARAWTWPPLLWSEPGLLLLLIGFSLSTAGPLFAPWAAETLQKGGQRHISSDLYLFPGAGHLFEPWAAEILQKGGHRHISSDLYHFLASGPCFEPWGRDPPKRGPPPHQLRSLPFSRRWTPFWAVRGRDPPKRGTPPHQLRSLTFSRRWFFCAGKVHCFSARGFRCRQFMLGLLLLRYYNARAWTWPPLLRSETGPFLLLIGFSLSTAGPGLSRERARSFKKGATATSAQTFTLFQALDPFLRPERPRSSNKGATATSAQTFTLFQALDPFLSRERPRFSQKGATATSAPIFTIFQARDPL